MSEVVLLPSKNNPFGWKWTRLVEWKRYLSIFKPINEDLVECGIMERWQVEKAEKELKKQLLRRT